MTIRIQEDDFDLASIYAELREPLAPPSEATPSEATPSEGSLSAGAISLFIGLVRDINNNQQIDAMTLEHYPGMTEAKLTAIRDQAMRRWQLGKAIIIHRVGKLYPNDQIVLVGATSPHRHAACDATAFMMDHLKTEAPFWKSEQTADGNTKWVASRDSDITARSRWQKA